ncbi:hypothetical protein KY285_004277 [Solanum tuberosum]|nr:hypothetical protein KY285_004277 [Solanum tuberosum]
MHLASAKKCVLYQIGMRNVCGNFKRSRNILSDLFYSMAKTYINEDFDKLMAKVDKVNHKVKEYLEDAGYEK